MGKGKILFGLLLIGLIVGALIGIAFLFYIIFMTVYWWFTDIMVLQGANSEIAPIVALILTVWIFFKVSSNQTVRNYITEKGSKWSREIF